MRDDENEAEVVVPVPPLRAARRNVVDIDVHEDRLALVEGHTRLLARLAARGVGGRDVAGLEVATRLEPACEPVVPHDE